MLFEHSTPLFTSLPVMKLNGFSLRLLLPAIFGFGLNPFSRITSCILPEKFPPLRVEIAATFSQN